ncbi:MAG: hypothetical protein PHT84_05605, partial [Candidatus Pacebacteria bacterium]|nr:hypothetical protein [Candidatus Paceibacterota bacterium]
TDLRFVKRGVMTTIKGKSHSFKRIAPEENVFDPPALVTAETQEPDPVPKYDFTGENEHPADVEMDKDIDAILLAEQERPDEDRVDNMDGEDMIPEKETSPDEKPIGEDFNAYL